MRLPVVTKDNLDRSKNLLETLLEDRESLNLTHPLELEHDFPHFRMVICSTEEYDALVFGVALLIKTVESGTPFNYQRVPESVRIQLPTPSTGFAKFITKLSK